jgi:hypothetical protein
MSTPAAFHGSSFGSLMAEQAISRPPTWMVLSDALTSTSSNVPCTLS